MPKIFVSLIRAVYGWIKQDFQNTSYFLVVEKWEGTLKFEYFKKKSSFQLITTHKNFSKKIKPPLSNLWKASNVFTLTSHNMTKKTWCQICLVYFWYIFWILRLNKQKHAQVWKSKQLNDLVFSTIEVKLFACCSLLVTEVLSLLIRFFAM